MSYFWANRTTWRSFFRLRTFCFCRATIESFGLVALEAMACEVPVVATRVGGLPEVVRHGTDGYLCALGDVESMAEAWVSE